jgi:hypothetical protein
VTFTVRGSVYFGLNNLGKRLYLQPARSGLKLLRSCRTLLIGQPCRCVGRNRTASVAGGPAGPVAVTRFCAASRSASQPPTADAPLCRCGRNDAQQPCCVCRRTRSVAVKEPTSAMPIRRDRHARSQTFAAFSAALLSPSADAAVSLPLYAPTPALLIALLLLFAGLTLVIGGLSTLRDLPRHAAPTAAPQPDSDDVSAAV